MIKIDQIFFNKKIWPWAPVAQACNPSYSGGRDQEDQSLKPTGQIVGDLEFVGQM
jgi:hypothetical protein